jgi:hypothetical protein
MKKRFVLYTVLLLFMPFVHAQVRLQTGGTEYSIPFLNYVDSKSGLSANINLEYAGANGIKVAQIANNVGLGWQLDFGGFIQRQVNGEPDDQFNPNEGAGFTPYAPYTTNYALEQSVYPNGYLYSTYTPTDIIPGSASYVPMFSGQNLKYKNPMNIVADRELDIFSFTMNGRIGRFIIGKDWVVKSLNDTKLKFEILTEDLSSQNIRTKIKKFIITNESGIKYHFDITELTEATIEEPGYNGVEIGCTTNFVPDPYSSSSTIGRYFKSVGIGKYIINKWLLSKIENPWTGEKIQFNYITRNYNYIAERDYNYTKEYQATGGIVSISENRVISSSPVPDEIVFPDNSKCKFLYNSQPRYDLVNDSPLDRLVFYNPQGNKIYGYRFEYGYFLNDQITPLTQAYSENEKKVLRLCLLSVQKEGKGASAIPKTVFEYNIGNINGYDFKMPDRLSYNKDFWGYTNSNSEVNSTACNNLVFQLLLNTYDPNSRSPHYKAATGMLRRVKLPHGGYTEWIYTYPANGDQFAGCRVKEIVQSDGANQDKDIHTTYKYILENTNTTSGWGYEQPQNNLYSFQTRIWKSQQQVYAGQAIKQIISSTLMGNNGFMQFAVSQIVQSIIFNLSSNFQDKSMERYSLYNPVVLNPLPFQYSRVEVQQIGVTPNGKTVYEFTSPSDYPLLVSNYQFPFSSKQRAIDEYYGLPKKVLIYNATGTPVRKTEYTYNYDNQLLQSSLYKSLYWMPNRFNYMNNNARNIPLETISASEVTTETYAPNVSKVFLSQTKETSFNTDNTSFETISNFEYNTVNNQLKRISKQNSKGETIDKYTFYPGDYNIPGHITADMIANNMNNYPVSSETWVTKPNVPKSLLELNIVDYIKLLNNEIKPANVQNLEANEPVSVNTIGNFNPAILNRNPGLIKQQKAFVYNPANGLLTESTEHGRKTAVVYGYNNRQVIATAVNASQDNIAYSSFESEDLGGWNIPFSGITSQDWVTGKKAFNLINPVLGQSYPITKSNLNLSVQYIVTLWKKVGDVFVNGSAGSLIYKKDDWLLMKFELTGITGISITGTATIDELRLFPKNALMSTVTYEPYIGKTSECDANNRLIYYEYDDFGRLKLIRDEKWNVLKTYEYNYKQ